jgi:hypothetical protein
VGDPIVFLEPQSANNDANYFGALPAIQIQNYVTGFDADAATGPYLKTGNSAEFSFVVTNTGNVPLTNIVVSDDVLGVITSCVDESDGSVTLAGYTLAVGAGIRCTRFATVEAGAHANLGSVTAIGPNTLDENGASVPGIEVSADDPAHYFGVSPAVQIVKKVQTLFDANSPQGPLVAIGTTVQWDYEITNTGNVPLTGITVVDDNGTPGSPGDDFSVTCATELAVDESATCTAASGTAVAGQFTNVATVSATAPTTWATVVFQGLNPSVVIGDPPNLVGDDDNANYYGSDPQIEVLKSVQTYPADLSDEVYPDEALGAVPVRDGDLVIYHYEVTNTGNVPLTNIVVTDDQIFDFLVNCGTSANLIASLQPLETRTCFYLLGASDAELHADGLTNIAGVTSDSPATVTTTGQVVPGTGATDDNPATFFVAQPDVDIEKHVQTTFDADTPTGPIVSVRDQGIDANVVLFSYIVTNTGNVDLVDIVVTDSDLGSVTNCEDGEEFDLSNDPLEPGNSVTCYLKALATAGQYMNNGDVVATPLPAYDAEGEEVELEDVTDDDDAHYFGSLPSITINKWINGEDADTEPGAIVLIGDPMNFSYVVTNTGNVVLTDVTVVDDKGYSVDCGEGTGHVIADLAIDEQVTCTASITSSVPGAHVNVGSVTGQAPTSYATNGDPIDGEIVEDKDTAYAFVAVTEVDITKYVLTDVENDANTAPGPLMNRNSLASWKITVENTGNVILYDVEVTDATMAALGADIVCEGGFTTIAVMNPGATETCSVSTLVTSLGLFTNTATATASPQYDLPEINDSDDANYTGVVSGGWGDILPATGSSLASMLVSLAALVTAAGALMFGATRRRRTI